MKYCLIKSLRVQMDDWGWGGMEKLRGEGGTGAVLSMEKRGQTHLHPNGTEANLISQKKGGRKYIDQGRNLNRPLGKECVQPGRCCYSRHRPKREQATTQKSRHRRRRERGNETPNN